MCECIEKVDGMLAEHNTRLTRAITFGSGEMGLCLMIATEVVEKKRGAKAVKMFPRFCPFCGEKYPDRESPAS